jgi:hemerythrin-like metal-binding protein
MDSGIAVSQRASHSLQSVSSAIIATSNVAETLSASTREMRAASANVADNMTSTSAAVEENSAAAAEMRSTTDHVTSIIIPIAATASQNASTAQGAAAAAQALAIGINEIEVTAGSLRDQAAELESLVGQFVLDTTSGVSADVPGRTLKMTQPSGTKSLKTMFEWDEKYATNNELIDREHKQLFAYAADLHRAMLERRGSDVVAALLGALADYTATHFAHEEALQKRIGYPDMTNHFKIHAALIERVAALQRDVAQGKTSVSLSLMEFLKNWLQHHIGVEDQKVADHARKMELTA